MADFILVLSPNFERRWEIFINSIDINPNNILLSNIDSAYPIVKVGDLGNSEVAYTYLPNQTKIIHSAQRRLR